MSKSSTSRFLTGVLTMAVSQLIIKLAGLVYRLVITNVPGFGDVGNGFYTAGFQIYTLLLSHSVGLILWHRLGLLRGLVLRGGLYRALYH